MDATPPEIHLDRPADGLVTGDREQVFEGSLGETASLTLNGTEVPLSGLSFHHGPVLLEEGENAFLLKAMDPAGNTSELALTVTLHTTPSDPLPPDPATVAPPPDPTVASDLAVDTAFLYTGIQARIRSRPGSPRARSSRAARP